MATTVFPPATRSQEPLGQAAFKLDKAAVLNWVSVHGCLVCGGTAGPDVTVRSSSESYFPFECRSPTKAVLRTWYSAAFNVLVGLRMLPVFHLWSALVFTLTGAMPGSSPTAGAPRVAAAVCAVILLLLAFRGAWLP